MTDTKTPEITVKKSYKDGHVKVCISLKSQGWNSSSVIVQGSTDINSEQARVLAAALIAEADRVDAKVTAKTASDARRKKWRDREIAAGRMKVIELGSLLSDIKGRVSQ